MKKPDIATLITLYATWLLLKMEMDAKIDSVKNPISGKLVAPEIGTLIMDPNKIDPAKTIIDCPKIGKKVDQSDMNQEPKDW